MPTPDQTAQFLGPLDKSAPPQDVTAPAGGEVTLGQVGRSGTYIFNGIITQEEYNGDLARTAALQIYDQMRRGDGTVAAVLLACKLPILSATWSIEAASDKPVDVDIANFISRELFGRKLMFNDFQREALSFFDFGYSVFEKELEFTKYNGKELLGLAGLYSRKQRSVYYWETADHEPGITQVVIGGTYSIPRSKLAIFTNNKEGDNYEGISILRPAYKHWQIKDKLYLIDAIKHERQGLGIVGIKVPVNAHQSDIDNAITAARNIRANEEAWIKEAEGFEIDFKDMKASTTTNVMDSVSHHDRQISKSVLGQFLELGASGGSGSRALSADHSRLFMLAEEAAAKTFANTVQQDIINYLVDLNFTGFTDYPKLEHSRIGDEDVTELSDAISKLATTNMLTPDADLEQAVRDTLHLPALPDDYRKDYANRPKAGGNTPTPDPVATSNPGDGNSGASNLTASARNRAIQARAELLEAIDAEYAQSQY